jgi:hypothetical protein
VLQSLHCALSMFWRLEATERKHKQKRKKDEAKAVVIIGGRSSHILDSLHESMYIKSGSPPVVTLCEFCGTVAVALAATTTSLAGWLTKLISIYRHMLLLHHDPAALIGRWSPKIR